jgi:YebC/PmpR family DNA-binding regulatory protein
MGRAFEFRKARKMKRWGQMAKTFTKIGKEIAMSVKEGGPNPDTNSRLRVAIQNAKAANMPKDNVERAIAKASAKDAASFKEMVYEGYAPFGVALIIETATDNTTRTVANVRAIFNKFDGSLGTSGSLSFIFDHKCIFKVPAAGINVEELEFELIDFGAEEVELDENEIIIYADFGSFGSIQKALESKKIEIISANFEYIPNDFKEITPEQEETINKMIERLEDDDDVQAVFHNIK